MSRKLIDRDALIASIPKTNVDIFENCRSCSTLCDWQVKELIDKMPTIDAVEVVHGMWLEEGNSCSYIFHCSVCGGVAYFVHGKGRGRNMERRFCGYRYCPNCGAKMDGERRDNE